MSVDKGMNEGKISAFFGVRFFDLFFYSSAEISFAAQGRYKYDTMAASAWLSNDTQISWVAYHLKTTEQRRKFL